MATRAFNYFSTFGETEILEYYELAASQTILAGDPLKFDTLGKLTAIAAQTDVVHCVAKTNGTSTSTSKTTIPVVMTRGGLQHFSTIFTPLLDDIAVNSGSTTTILAALTDGSADDLNGGTVYVKELDEQRVILDSSYSSNVVTITVLTPFSQAVDNTMTVRMVPFGAGDSAVKLLATTFRGISAVRADQSSGKLSVFAVDMPKKRAIIGFNAS